jgi:hypothetical protein
MMINGCGPYNVPYLGGHLPTSSKGLHPRRAADAPTYLGWSTARLSGQCRRAQILAGPSRKPTIHRIPQQISTPSHACGRFLILMLSTLGRGTAIWSKCSFALLEAGPKFTVVDERLAP